MQNPTWSFPTYGTGARSFEKQFRPNNTMDTHYRCLHNFRRMERRLPAALKQACVAKVGAGKPCSVAVMYGLANYPTDAYRTGVLKSMFKTGPIKLQFTPPGNYDQATAQKVTLDFFQTKPHVDVFGTFGDQMNAGADVAFKQLGLKPGKDFLEVGFGNTKQGIAWIKSGLWYSSGAYYPTTASVIAVKTLVDALNGKKVPTTINILHQPGTPLVIDQAFLKSHPSFMADWSL